MNHPTTQELFEFIDNRLNEGRAATITIHLAECALCRRRAELERATRLMVRSEPLVKARAGFSASVMVNLVMPRQDSLVLRVLNKMGSLVAMIVVLVVIGIAISNVSSVTDQSDTTSTSITQLVAPLSAMYTKGTETFVNRSTTIAQAIENAGDVRFWKTVLIVALSIGVLAAADKVFGKRFLNLKP